VNENQSVGRRMSAVGRRLKTFAIGFALIALAAQLFALQYFLRETPTTLEKIVVYTEVPIMCLLGIWKITRAFRNRETADNATT